MKPNCYDCKWRGIIPGDAHNCCRHPSNKKIMDDPLLKLMSIFAGVNRIAPFQAPTKLNVKGHLTGIQNGWFNWPFNFDPRCLEECDGFESKDTGEEEHG